MSVLKESQHLKIPLKEIEIATNNFQVCIGKGGFGMVYKGELSLFGKSTIVAVKRLNEQFNNQGLKEFLIEIQLLTGQKHPNLITLLGYCDEGKEKIIVYEYAEHGSLDQYLRRSNIIHALTYLERLKICVDAARGLNHLHNHVGKHQTIIHRDIKSANILIDHNWVAKISDLGLSKLSLAGLNRSAVISYGCGTQGYCEPEYFSTGIVKKESDVYSFGMVLFEVLCDRLCFTTGDDGLLFSAPLAKDYYKKKKLDEIVDLGLREQMSLEMMHKFSTIAYECLQDVREQRPPMDLVVKELEELLEIQLSSYTLEAPSKISKPAFASTGPSTISSEVNHVVTEIISHESETELHSFDKTLQARAYDVINSLDMGVEDKAMSFDSEKEGTQILLEINEEAMEVALTSKRDIWKSEKLIKLVKDFIENNSQALDFCNSLEKCLKRVRDIRLLILVALQHFDDENGVEETRYEKTLKKLKNFLSAGESFTQDFFKIFNFVYRRQVVFLEKLGRRKQQAMKKLNSLLTIYKNGIREHIEVINYLVIGSMKTIKDLDVIRYLVDKILLLHIENYKSKAEFAIKMDDAVEMVLKDIKQHVDSFSKDVEELETKANSCTHSIQRVKNFALHAIIKPPK